MVTEAKLSPSELIRLVEQAVIMEADSHGAKVYRLENGQFLKIFRRKRLLSSALLKPYSKRFIANAEALTARGVPTVRPLGHFSLQEAGSKAVLYEPLKGNTLRSLVSSSNFSWDAFIQPLTELVRNLHEQGIYFRSLHIGNIVVDPEGRLGLIDIADMKVLSRPLPLRLRYRNIAHFKRYLAHEKLLASFPIDDFEKKALQRQNDQSSQARSK